MSRRVEARCDGCGAAAYVQDFSEMPPDWFRFAIELSRPEAPYRPGALDKLSGEVCSRACFLKRAQSATIGALIGYIADEPHAERAS